MTNSRHSACSVDRSAAKLNLPSSVSEIGSATALHDNLHERVRPELSRILIIDGDPLVREKIYDLLHEDNRELVLEESSDQLESILRSCSSFDAILIDLVQPRDRVFSLMSLVKQRSPTTQLIILSNLAAGEAQGIEAIQRGAYDVLPKPLNRKELQKIVSNAVSRAKAIERAMEAAAQFKSGIDHDDSAVGTQLELSPNNLRFRDL